MGYMPSGWAILCIAVGATMIGMEILNPSTVVVKSTLVTSIKIRGRNLTEYGPITPQSTGSHETNKCNGVHAVIILQRWWWVSKLFSTALVLSMPREWKSSSEVLGFQPCYMLVTHWHIWITPWICFLEQRNCSEPPSRRDILGKCTLPGYKDTVRWDNAQTLLPSSEGDHHGHHRHWPDPLKCLSVLFQGPLILSPRGIIVKDHLWKLVLGCLLILTDIYYLCRHDDDGLAVCSEVFRLLQVGSLRVARTIISSGRSWLSCCNYQTCGLYDVLFSFQHTCFFISCELYPPATCKNGRRAQKNSIEWKFLVLHGGRSCCSDTQAGQTGPWGRIDFLQVHITWNKRKIYQCRKGQHRNTLAVYRLQTQNLPQFQFLAAIHNMWERM